MKTLDWCKSLKFWLVLILCFSGSLLAKDLKTFGIIYEIKETDILSVIEERLMEQQQKDGFKKIEAEMEENARAYVQRPTPVSGLSKTLHPRRFFYDPTLVVSEDLKDAQGKIFHHKGEQVNPLKTFSLEKPLVFINADDKAQLDWALAFEEKNQESILILVQGSVFELMRQLKRPLYFDQGGWLIRKFGIQQVPAWVSQTGKKLIIEEVKID